MIYLTAIGLTPGGSSTNLHANITQNNTKKQYMEQHIIDTKQYIEQLNLLLYCCSVFKANTLINAQSNQVAVL